MIYLPIEVVERELESKAILACLLAKYNYKVFLFEHTFFDRFGWPGEGVYVGKNFYRIVGKKNFNNKLLNEMIKSKIKVIHLDEEGAIYNGKSEKEWNKTLQRRLDINFPKNLIDVFTWGDWQKNFFKKKDNFKKKIITTGHPRFELSKKKYNKYFKEIDYKVTKGHKNYILVNTIFHVANPKNDFVKDGLIKGYKNKKIYDKKVKTAKILIKKTCDLINEISNTEKIILRPHPCENSDFYEEIFKCNNNVYVENNGNVTSWIRNAKIVIHTSCTTGLQSILNEKPTFAFVPKINNDFYFQFSQLPNQSSYVFSNFKQLKFYLNNFQLKKRLSNKFQKYLDTKENTFYKIKNYINKNYKNAALYYKDYKIKNSLLNNLRIKLKKLINLNNQVFKYHEFSLLGSIITIGEKIFNVQVKINKICDGVYLIEKKK
ncbi:hypothetical protein OAT00_03620 [Pelagibacteraceae bacterium]|nr:hypothetical protein [Pelagibacteraceae bacterium]